MPRRVICIARLQGAGGADISRAVAEALGYRLVDEEILLRAAESQGVTVDELQGAERRSSVVSRLLDGLAFGAAADMYTGVAMPVSFTAYHDPRSLRALIQTSIQETAESHDVVIVSHAASFALAGRAEVLRVLVTASPATRIARIAEADSLDHKHAAKVVADDDLGRAAYLKRFYDISDELPSHYDIVLNSDSLPAEVIADLVVRAAQSG